MREKLFGFGEAPPEYFPPARQRFLIIFSWATWIYRLVLYISIALLVYHAFAKVLGIALMLVEFGWFILLPIQNELKAWWKRRELMHWSPQVFRAIAFI